MIVPQSRSVKCFQKMFINVVYKINALVVTQKLNFVFQNCDGEVVIVKRLIVNKLISRPEDTQDCLWLLISLQSTPDLREQMENSRKQLLKSWRVWKLIKIPANSKPVNVHNNFCPNMKKTWAVDNILVVVADAVVMSTLVTVVVDTSCRICGH